MTKSAAGIVIAGMFLVLIAHIAGRMAGNYHLGEFQKLKTNFNNYSPTMLDRLRGIRDNQAKYNFHLRSLEELGVVQHQSFVFTNVAYSRESSKRIFRSANSNFPNAVMFLAKYYGTNQAGYGDKPYVMEVWDFPREMPHWVSFFQTNNVAFRPP